MLTDDSICSLASSFEAFQGFHQGVRQSGIGGEDGELGVEEYLETHVCYVDWDTSRNKE